MLHRFHTYCYYLIALTLFTLNAQDLVSPNHSTDEKGKPYIRNYLPTEYKANPQNWAIVQDNQGIMYFGNGNGVLMFDGSTWQMIRTTHRTSVRSLALWQNTVFVGSQNDFGFLTSSVKGEVKYQSLIEKLEPTDRDFKDVWHIVVSSDQIFFLSRTKLFAYDGESIKVYTATGAFRDAFVVNSQLHVNQHPYGLMKLSSDTLAIIESGKRFSRDRIYAALPYAGDTTLICSRYSGLFLFEDDELMPFASEADDFLKQNRLYSGAKLQDESFALSTLAGGAAIIDSDGRVLQFIDKQSGLHTDKIYSSYVDRNGGLWVALSNGLSRVEVASPLSRFDASTGVEGIVTDIIRFRGKIYAASLSGVFVLDAGNRESDPRFTKIRDLETQAWKLLSAGGSLFVATTDGLSRIQNKRALKIETGWRVAVRYLYNAEFDSTIVIAGTSEGVGLLKLDNGGLRPILKLDGIKADIASINEENASTIWLGTQYEGAIRLKHTGTAGLVSQEAFVKSIDLFGSDHELPDDLVRTTMLNDQVRFLTQQGLRKFDPVNSKFVPANTYGTMFSDTASWVYDAVMDMFGGVWLLAGNSERRLYGVSLPDRNGEYVFKDKPFTRLNDFGFLAVVYPELTISASDTLYTVWFGGSEGVVRYQARTASTAYSDFSTLVRRVSVARDSVIFGGASPNDSILQSQSLVYESNSLRFEFASPFYDVPEKTAYRTKLDGFDAEWSSWSDEVRRDYTNLPEGDYEFQAEARNVYNRSGATASYNFSILPPWYRTWLAYFIYLNLTLLVVALGIRYGMNITRKRERDKARLREAEIVTRKNQELSEKNIQLQTTLGELRVAQDEIRRTLALLEDENQRKSEELEKARELQLSMLPRDLPELNNVEIAAYMDTASEVGGDYYDIYQGNNGELTITIGDATGHGLNAGMMVAATKSLFQALAPNYGPLELTETMNRMLKRVNLKQLYMALQTIKLRENALVISTAGMPPALLFKSEEQTVEELIIKAMPLGAVGAFPYKELERTVSPGDTLLLMSDGFPEMHNADGKMIGYDRAGKILADIAHLPASGIIGHFVQEAASWLDGKPQDDDMTFVALKFK